MREQQGEAALTKTATNKRESKPKYMRLAIPLKTIENAKKHPSIARFGNPKYLDQMFRHAMEKMDADTLVKLFEATFNAPRDPQ